MLILIFGVKKTNKQQSYLFYFILLIKAINTISKTINLHMIKHRISNVDSY
jgi:hypothetical protein